jgi:hypothetical protein
MPRYYVHGAGSAFSVTEEADFYRMTIGRPKVDQDDAEDFLDTTVEWLSLNPTKGILVDFTGVSRNYASVLPLPGLGCGDPSNDGSPDTKKAPAWSPTRPEGEQNRRHVAEKLILSCAWA